MEILLKSETIAHLGTFPITNTLIASTIVVITLCLIAWVIKRTKYDLKSRLYNFAELVIEALLGVVEGVVGRGQLAKKIFSILVTFFLFIIVNNWFGIFPGMGSLGFWESKSAIESTESAHAPAASEATTAPESPVTESAAAHPEEATGQAEEEKIFVPLLRSANSDLNMTLAIAFISVIFIQFIGVNTIGWKHYLSKFFNFSNPIMFFIGLLELISEFIKIFSLSFRLFGNIFAGDVLLIVMFTLAPFLAPLPFMGIEMFAGFLQALIFSMLSLMFIQSSVSHGHE